MIRQLTNKDYAAAMEYILRNETETTFLYGNVAVFGMENDPEVRRCGDYFGYFEDNILKGILAFYNLGSCIVHYEAEGAVQAFADIMKKYRFEYLQGMKKIIKPLYEIVAQSREVLEEDDSFYLVNQDFRPFKVSGLRFADAVKDKSDEAIDFIMETREKGFQQKVTRDGIYKTLEQRGAEEDYILAEANGRFVAGACIQTYTPSINQIGGVYTTEQERGKGYAKAVVSELCSKIIERGKMPTLFVIKANTPAYRAYTALGFKRHDDYLLIRFKV